MLRLYIPVPPFKYFLYHPCHTPCPKSLPIFHPLTELPRYFHPIIPPLPVLDLLSTWTSIHSRRLTMPVPVIAVLPPSTCYPCPCRPLHPRTAIPFLTPLPLSGCPPITALDVASVPVNPCGFALLGYFLPPPFLEPLLPPGGLDLQPGPCQSRGGSGLQFLASCPPPSCFLFTRSYAAPSIGIFWYFVVFWAPVCALTRGLGVSNPWQSNAPALVPTGGLKSIELYVGLP